MGEGLAVDRLLADTGDQHFDLQLLRERLRILLNRLAPNAKTGPFPVASSGCREAFLCDEGASQGHLDGDEHVLKASDSCSTAAIRKGTTASRQTHRTQNISCQGEADIIWRCQRGWSATVRQARMGSVVPELVAATWRSSSSKLATRRFVISDTR